MKTFNINIDKLIDCIVIGDEFKFTDLGFMKKTNNDILLESLEFMNNFRL